MKTKAEITINFAISDTGEEENYWLRIISSEDLQDLITREEAAEFIDKIYDLEACNAEDTEGGEEPEKDENGNVPPPVEEDIFVENAKDFLSSSPLCLDGGEYDANLIVAKSHQQYEYKLVFDNGKETAREVVNEEIKPTYTLNNQKSLSLEFPVLSNFSLIWNGNIIGKYGTVIINPSYTLEGSTLYFTEELTGSISCAYTTQYDIVTVHVTYNGNDIEFAGTDVPKPQECNVVGFYQGTVTEYTITPPDKDESTDDGDAQRLCAGSGGGGRPPDNVSCYDEVTYITRCRCSGAEAHSTKVEVGVTCPERVKYCPGSSSCRHLVHTYTVTAGYTSCPDEEYLEGTVSDINYFIEKCCTPPPYPLPPCKSIKSAYAGGAAFNGNKDVYPPGTQFVAVGPKAGICGTVTTTYQVSSRNCCEFRDPLVVDEDRTSDTISMPGMAVCWASGGAPPYYWMCNAGYVFVENNSTRLTTFSSPPVAWIKTIDSKTVCSDAVVNLTDNCTNVSFRITQTAKSATITFPKNIIIAPSSELAVCAISDNVVPPYSWTADSGLTFESSTTSGLCNVLVASADFCGIGTITITDACGNSASAGVKSTDGHWERLPDTCDCGEASDGDITVINPTFWLVEADGYKCEVIIEAGSTWQGGEDCPPATCCMNDDYGIWSIYCPILAPAAMGPSAVGHYEEPCCVADTTYGHATITACVSYRQWKWVCN